MRALRLACLSFVVLLLAACSNSGHPQNTAQMRAVNVVAGSEPLDVLVSGDLKFTVPANSVSAFSQFTSGSEETLVRSSTSQTTLFDKSLPFGDGTVSTLVIYGPRSAVQAQLIPDDTPSPGGNTFNFRAMNVASDAPSVDVYLSSTPDVTNAAPVMTSTAYGATSGIAQVAPGKYSIVYTAAGTKDVLFASAPQTFAAGTSYTTLVTPSGGGHLVNALLLVQGEGGSGTFLGNPLARVKTVNGVAGSTAVNLRIDNKTLLSNVPYGGSSSYVAVPSGPHTFQLEASNVPGTTIASLTQALTPARDYSLFATGPLSHPSMIAFLDDNTVPGTGLARVRFVDALSDGTAVDVLLNFAGQASGIAPGTATGYYSLAPGTTYTIQFTTAGGVTLLATLSPVEIDAGHVYTIYIIGTAASATAGLNVDL